MPHICKCGWEFDTRRELIDHWELLNPDPPHRRRRLGEETPMRYRIDITVNTKGDEYDITRNGARSLDAVMQSILVDYPHCTSVVMAIVPEVEAKAETEQ